MSQNDFEINGRLLHFLSNRLGWRDLNSIQRKSIPHVLNHENTLILAPTASGKTEAALIPIFSEILNNNLKPCSVLYISPLKALINDMHNRIEKWGNHFGLTATKWHGDVYKNKKDKFMESPTDFLSTTPESLEVILMNRPFEEKERVFKNVKFILIDEIHYFAASDRGVQLNSILNRISKYTPDAAIIGLSATVGNPEIISNWVSLENPAKIIRDTGGRKLQYKVFNLSENDLPKILKKYMNKKVLIFANSRKVAESTYYNLTKKIKMKNIFIHHGSINKETREENEDKFKSVKNGFMVATTTLELGIDIGDIDLVVQLSSPSETSSFSQRIGRSGRRTKVQRTIILTYGFNLLVTLAEIMLHHEGEVERISISNKSFDILFHQILSSVYEKGKVDYKELYNDLSGCYAFSGISFQEYKNLLNEMDERDMLDITNNYLTLGYQFEKDFGKSNYKNFFAVFSPRFEYSILEGNNEVGTLDVAYAVDLGEGDQFNLAGKLWQVTSINHNRYKVQVQELNLNKAKLPSWNSDGAPISPLITNKIYEILQGNFDEKFLKPLDERSRWIIEMAIETAQEDGFSEGIIPVEINDSKEVYIFTFAGDKANKLLLKVFEMYYDLKNGYTTPIYTSFKTDEKLSTSEIESVVYDLENILSQSATEAMLDNLTASFKKNKFMEYLPEEVRGSLKMDLIFDKKALLDATLDKSLYFIESSQFRKRVFRFREEFEEENKE